MAACRSRDPAPCPRNSIPAPSSQRTENAEHNAAMSAAARTAVSRQSFRIVLRPHLHLQPLLYLPRFTLCTCFCAEPFSTATSAQSLIVLISGTRKSIGQRSCHHRLFFPGHQRCFRRGCGTGNPRCAINSMARSMGIRTLPCDLSDPAVVFQQQILFCMQVGDLLIAVIELQARRGKLLRRSAPLVLHSGLFARLPSSRTSTVLRPLASRPVHLGHVCIDQLADAIAEHARTRPQRCPAK